MLGWIPDSLVMFGASVVMYLFIRKGQKQGLPLMQYIFAMFVIPLIFFTLSIPLLHLSLQINWALLPLIIGAAFVFSYAGNIMSQQSIMLSSNPGYSLIISKSYVILTTIFAVVLLHAALSLKAAVAILLIVGFSALIVIGPKKSGGTKSMLWIWLALGACVCFAGLALVSTYLLKTGIPVMVWLFYLFLFVSSFIFAEMVINKRNILPKKGNVGTILMIGTMSALFNLFMQIGYKEAPNPGYINAANAASITLVTLLSAYFFKDELNLRKIIGIVGVTVGLLVLFL